MIDVQQLCNETNGILLVGRDLALLHLFCIEHRSCLLHAMQQRFRSHQATSHPTCQWSTVKMRG